jgi:hypothetical protein
VIFELKGLNWWQVLTISGVARVFVTKRMLLTALGDFPKAWRLLLGKYQINDTK